MKIVTIVGARPQFIKASVVSKALKKINGIDEIIIHTGQHYDKNMSAIFFEQLNIPQPSYNLNINQGSHGQMTGRMLEGIEDILIVEKPDYVLVYGDTDSTLAGALAAAKSHIPIAHVEAGLRSHNRKMPEEINRVLTDELSHVLFCPTSLAVKNIERENRWGARAEVLLVGDVMQDAAMMFSDFSLCGGSKSVENIPTDYILATLHREENTNNIDRLTSIINALNTINQDIKPVVMPLHPRTKKIINEQGLKLNVNLLEPLSYIEMLQLIKNSSLVMTDSGGLQKESYFFEKNCVTLRDETEWVELTDLGVNQCVGADYELICQATNELVEKGIDIDPSIYGGGQASSRIAQYFNDKALGS
jgi:UDP-GlcNAc3NAcA epimerase